MDQAGYFLYTPLRVPAHRQVTLLTALVRHPVKSKLLLCMEMEAIAQGRQEELGACSLAKQR